MHEDIGVIVGMAAAALFVAEVTAILYSRLLHLMRPLILSIPKKPERQTEIPDEARAKDAVTVEKKPAEIWASALLPIPLSSSQLALARLLAGAIPAAIALGIFVVFRQDQGTAIFAACSVYGALTVAAFQWIFPALFTES